MVSLADDLSWGPIGSHDPEQRISFFNTACPVRGGWDWLSEAHESFWREAAKSGEERHVWLASRSPAELAGYLAFLERFGELPTKVIRVDNMLLRDPVRGFPPTVGALSLDEIDYLLDNAPCEDLCHDSAFFGRWKELREESALLRIVSKGELVSAPTDHHDHLLLGAVGEKWKLSVRAVADALAAAIDSGCHVSDFFLFSRLAALVSSGTLEAEGDVLGWTQDGKRAASRVRRALPSSVTALRS